MDTKTPLAPTAALVLQMGLPIYQEAASRKYLSLVDMSSGDEMFHQINRPIEVLNRKFFIRQFMLNLAKASPTSMQWVMLAAGVCPMPLEILSLVPDKISHVFEIDVAFMQRPSWPKKLAASPMILLIPIWQSYWRYNMASNATCLHFYKWKGLPITLVTTLFRPF